MTTRVLSVALAVALTAGAAAAQAKKPLTAAEMQELLKNGLTVTTTDLRGGKDFSGTVTLAADGKLSGSVTPAGGPPTAISGVWKLKGAQLCRTLNPIEAKETCESWVRTGPKEVIVQVGGKDLVKNRWQ